MVSSLMPTVDEKNPGGPELIPSVYLSYFVDPVPQFTTRVGFDFPNDSRNTVLRWDNYDQMHLVALDAVPLNFNVRVIPLNVENVLLNKTLYLSLQYPFAILGDPNNMILVVICPMSTESDFHDQTLPYRIDWPQTKERFHPRAYACGPQLLI
jgi:hypothetical protein